MSEDNTSNNSSIGGGLEVSTPLKVGHEKIYSVFRGGGEKRFQTYFVLPPYIQ